MRDSSDAGGAIHMRTTVIGARLSGMDRHPDAHRHILWPGFFAKGALNLTCRRNGVGRAREYGKDTVAFAPFEDNRAIVGLDAFRHDLVVPPERRLHFGWMGLPGPGRSFHVREQEGHRPRWPLRHSMKLLNSCGSGQ